MLFLMLFLAIILIAITVFVINNSYASAVKKAQVEIFSALNEAAIVLDAKGNILLFNERAEKLTNISSQK